MAKTLVIVESPTKAKTIRKFLGKEFIVESCMGHIRDLPQSAKDIPEKLKKEKWASLGVNVDKNFEPIYCVPKNKTKIVSQLKKKLKEADELILATDEDREGESISWHLLEVLKPKVPVKRMVFHEITKTAIKKALDNFRVIDSNLVKAQEARRILDRLVGYTISPLVWKKVAYGLSAGRVQSVAVRLICEREYARLHFKKSDYYGVQGELAKAKEVFSAKLSLVKGKKVAIGKDFDPDTGKLRQDKKDTIVLNESESKSIIKGLNSEDFIVKSVDEFPFSRKPAPPFITSTLQQEANRKLGLGARESMRVAQSLYEKGFITYMRTDSTFLSGEALKAARACIKDLYGKEYLPKEHREYQKKKVKGAQEAHEAIRPASDDWVKPEDTKLKDIELRVYDLIWKRAVASQMLDSQQKRLSVKIEAGDTEFSASGVSIEFPGFLRAYVEGSDDADQALENKEIKLPKMKVGEKLNCKSLVASAHETKPPARYTEASLVQIMEKEGIGRPSTYAPTISTIQDRGYVRKEGNALVPTFTALIVSKLLENHLPQYVDLGFTSEMEKSLDEVADGSLDSIRYLKDIYSSKNGLRIQVEKQGDKIDPEKARTICLVGLEGYPIRVGRYGAYVCRTENGEEVCASLPDNQAPADISPNIINELIDQKLKGTDAFCKDPDTGKPIYLLNGRYGPYVQLGDITEEAAKPKRVALPPGVTISDVTESMAIFLTELPKEIGLHPETKESVKVGLGRFGPFILYQGEFRSIPKTDSIFEISLDRATEILATPKRTRGRAAAIKDLGKHPKTEEEIQVFSGRYGPYIKFAKKNISLPDDVDVEKFDLAQAVELIQEKIGDVSSGPAKKAKAKKKTKKKSTASKKTPSKKKAKKQTKKKAPAKSTASSKKKSVLRKKTKS